MWPNPQFPADMVTFTEEIINGKLHFLCSEFFLFFLTAFLDELLFWTFFLKKGQVYWFKFINVQPSSKAFAFKYSVKKLFFQAFFQAHFYNR